MIKLFRISKTKYISDLTGTGAKLYGGRWNSKGKGILYTAENISLCAFEFFVHLPSPLLPDDLSIATTNVGNNPSTQTLKASDLPADWKQYPAPLRLAEIGNKWLAEQSSLLLRVPSVIIPQDFNVLVNPNHPEFGNVKIEKIEPFEYDRRMLK